MTASTSSDERLLIWMMIEDDVAVKLAGVVTFMVLPLAARDVDPAAATVIGVDVDDVGALPPVHPVVTKLWAVEVAELPAASRDTTL
jgi:hypothetical protein